MGVYYDYVFNRTIKYMITVLINIYIFVVMLQLQIILQYFYKLLMWRILISYKMGPLRTSHLCLPIIIWKLLKSHQQFVKLL